MAKKFVRGVTGVKDIEKFDVSLTNVNDIISDGQHTYIHTKNGESESYYNLTNNINAISSSNNDLIDVTNRNNTITLNPKHDAQKEQVLDSTRDTITINHGRNGTAEKTTVETNPQKVLEHDNLLTGYGITKTTNQDTSTLSISDEFQNYVSSIGENPKVVKNIIQTVHEHSYFDNTHVGDSPTLKSHNDYTAYIAPVKPNTTISSSRDIGETFSQYLDKNLKVVSNIGDSQTSPCQYKVPSNACWAYITINSTKLNLVVVNHDSLGRYLSYSELPNQAIYGYVFDEKIIPKNKFDELLTKGNGNIELHVGSGQTYSTIEEALANVTNSSIFKQYDIVLHAGKHYFKMTGTNKLPDYVNIKGATGNYEDVVITGELPDSSDDNTITQTSTFNVSKNNNFENVTITARNMRYTIHDESNGVDKDWVRKVTNCHIIHYGNKGAYTYRQTNHQPTSGLWINTRAWGEGASSGSHSYYNNVIFESPVQPWYVHEPGSENSPKPYYRIFNNCVFKSTAVEYGGYGGGITIDNNTKRTEAKNVIIFNNCSFERVKIRINGDVPIDVRVHGSSIIPIQVSNLINFPKTDNTMLFYYDGDEALTGFEKLALNKSKGYEYVIKATEATPASEIVGINVTGTVTKGQTVMTSCDKFIYNSSGILYI